MRTTFCDPLQITPLPPPPLPAAAAAGGVLPILTDSFEAAVLSNTNVGGENCHRGAALGALMGAALGEAAIPPRLITGLSQHEALRQEIDAFCAAVLPGTAVGSSAQATGAAAPVH